MEQLNSLVGGGDGDDKGKETGIDKAEYERVKAENEKLQRDLEDTKMTVFSDDYMDFLEKKEKGGGAPPQATPAPEPDDATFEKLSKKELFERAKAAAIEEMKKEFDGFKGESQKQEQARVRAEIKAFADTHPDFPKFKPIMAGLSADPKYADMTITQLYEKAKEHVTSLVNPKPSPEEIEKQKKLAADKPGFGDASYDRLRKLTPEQAAAEAFAEIKASLGPIPSA